MISKQLAILLPRLPFRYYFIPPWKIMDFLHTQKPLLGPLLHEGLPSLTPYTPLFQHGGLIPSTVISSTRGSTRVSLSSNVSSDPKLLQFFVESEARRMPNPVVRLIGTHTERRPRDRGTNETTVSDFDIQISMADLLVSAWRRTRLAENHDKVYRGGRLKSVATG